MKVEEGECKKRETCEGRRRSKMKDEMELERDKRKGDGRKGSGCARRMERIMRDETNGVSQALLVIGVAD